jgi:hypothetical protein
MEIQNLMNYVKTNYSTLLLNATKRHFKEYNINEELLDASCLQLLTISLFPKTEWFDLNYQMTSTKIDGPALFNVTWAKIQFVYKKFVPANSTVSYSTVIHVYLDGSIDANLLSLFNAATRMEPLLVDTITECYNAIVFSDHPGLRPLLHAVVFQFDHEKLNPKPPTLMLSIQWPEMVLLKLERSKFKLDHYYTLDSIKNGICSFTYGERNLPPLRFDAPLSQTTSMEKLDSILKRVKGDNLIVPLFVYESIVYGDVLVSRKYQDDYDVVMIRENGVKCCDHKMQQIEFLPISPLLGNYYPRRIPVRLESQEEAEKVIVRFFEE